MKGIILIDPKKCLGCKTCELQCALEHSESKVLTQAIYERPLPQSRLNVESAEELAIPLQCRHCEDAPCVKICPSKAMNRPEDNGPVLINNELCIGCKWCILVCPFGVIRIGREGKAITKCDLCFERLQKGEEPSCVQGCPTGALQFKPLEKMAKEEYLVKFTPLEKDLSFRTGFKKDKEMI